MTAVLSRNMVKVCKLFLQRNYKEAEKLMEKLNEPSYQKATLQAQLSFFSWDFEKTIECCKEYFPYLNEGHTYNMYDESCAMLTFSAIQTKKEKEVIKYLSDFKLDLLSDEDEIHNERIIRLIEKYIDILEGKIYEVRYTPPEKPMTFSEAVDYLREVNSKKDLSGDTQEDAAYILSRMAEKMDCNEYIKYYERFADSPKLSERTRVSAIEMYLYMNMPDKVRKAICDCCKYSWIPVEKIIIMPTAILTYDVNMWKMFTKEMFEYIYKTASVHFGGAV